MTATVISRSERDGGYIETLELPGNGELYYRSCAHGYCRYSSDLWQAEIYLDHMLVHSPASSRAHCRY